MPLTLQSSLMHLHSTVQSNDLKKTAVKGQYGKAISTIPVASMSLSRRFGL
ncbi:hypothetical protein HanRHA438_Chr01g0021241 [Helianthus annuus]|nr:hypothetical protein HanXRQr2_Chr01g0009391 [Helianthus annuus]KAJ0947908.1 hypothetical protein HanRHA438_Chr01g0021241 [Helianthus annuus]